MKYSHSRVELFNQCRYKFKLKYIDEIETLPDYEATNPLIIGTAIHHGIENSLQNAIKSYFMTYPIISDLHINESLKFENLVPKVKSILPKNFTFEYEINVDNFNGFIDGLEDLGNGEFNIYDFKYSNNIDHYMESAQLHLYKYYFEKQTGKKVKNLYYIFIPKTMIRQKKTEDLYQFRKRLLEILESLEPKIVKVDYDESKVEDFKKTIKEIPKEKNYEKNITDLCKFCEYKDFCEKGENYMLLPSVERRTVNTAKKRKMWIYGASFSGKTTMLDKAPNPLNLNTDGNIEFVTMPYIPIKDIVTVEGRITKRKFAWDVFKETIEELEKNQNEFKTIIVDLVEDTREICRLYKFDQMGIEHESDSGYGKGWDIIKTEYLSVIRRLFNLNYENIIVVSHELISEINKKNGQKITKITPNMPENIANKIAGMVDIVARVVVNEDGSRSLNFKSDEFVFGGGRLKGLETTSIPLDWDELMKVYNVAKIKEELKEEVAEEKETPPIINEDAKIEENTPSEEQPKRRTRKVRE